MSKEWQALAEELAALREQNAGLVEALSIARKKLAFAYGEDRSFMTKIDEALTAAGVKP